MNNKQIEIYKKMPSHIRIKTACQLHDFAHNRLISYYKNKFPLKKEKEIYKLVAKRFLHESTTIF